MRIEVFDEDLRGWVVLEDGFENERELKAAFRECQRFLPDAMLRMVK